MNTILLTSADFTNDSQVVLRDYRFTHITSVIKPTVGESLAVGVVDSKLGSAQVIVIGDDSITLKVTELNTEPPAALPAKLICALPRPKMFRRMLHMAVVSGVKEIHFIKSWRVDKSYWQSPLLSEESQEKIIREALSQTGDVIRPAITFHKLFKPFVQDQLPSIIENTTPLLFHPTGDSRFTPEKSKEYTLVIGPEGGFIPYEVEALINQGMECVTMGPRILQAEQATTAILGHMLLSIA